MDTQKYNGWTNWATWMVNLHFDGLDFTDEVDEGTFDDISKDDLRCQLAYLIQEYVESYLDEVADTSRCLIPTNNHCTCATMCFGYLRDSPSCFISRKHT
jgi:hypothetical protein